MVREDLRSRYTVNSHSTIEEAWSVIEANRHRSVIVTDGGMVVGTLSDGDLRKAMLARRLLMTPVHEVMNTNFTFLTEAERGRAEDVFREKDIFLLPVVDRDMNLIDIIAR